MARTLDQSMLEMALVGYEAEKARVAAAIAEIRAELEQRGPGRPEATATGADHLGPPKRRRMSKAGRARIAAAQRARWAAHKQHAQTEKPKKRKMSALGRGRLIGLKN